MIFLSSFLDILPDSKGQGKSSFCYSKGGGKQNTSMGGSGIGSRGGRMPVVGGGGVGVWVSLVGELTVEKGPGC